MIGLGGSKLAQPDLQRSRIRKNEADVESLVDLMENSWLNPMYPEETELVSISADDQDVQEETLKRSSTNNEIPRQSKT